MTPHYSSCSLQGCSTTKLKQYTQSVPMKCKYLRWWQTLISSEVKTHFSIIHLQQTEQWDNAEHRSREKNLHPCTSQHVLLSSPKHLLRLFSIAKLTWKRYFFVSSIIKYKNILHNIFACRYVILLTRCSC